LTFAALAVTCIAAAGAGGYLASRQNTVPTPAAASTALPASAMTPGAAAQPVQDADSAGDASKAPVAVERNGGTAPAVASKKNDSTPRNAAAKSASARSQQSVEASSQWKPSGAAAQPAAPPASSDPATTSTAADDRLAQEPARAPEPPEKVYEELVVSANSVIGLQTETRISTETARIEDRVDAKVTRDVRVGDMIAIPAGSRVIGSVIQVDRGGKFKDRARLGIRFTTLVLSDGTRIPMSTETIYRDGEAPSNGSAARIGGGAVGGAILGALLGGAKGAAIGATAGAGGGAAVVEAGDRHDVTLPSGSPLTVRLLTPVTVTIEQN
jgi:type IV secretory pathway VirB10-like protein